MNGDSPVSIMMIFPPQRETIFSKSGVCPMMSRRVPVFLRTASTAAHACCSGSSAHPRYHSGPSEP
jgi:hypothetical protein